MTVDLFVHGMTWEADGVLALSLVAADRGALPAWTPGAHIDLLLPNGLERQFSLCGDPDDRSRYRLGILREPQSRGATQYVHERLRPGDRVRAGAPRNNFALVDAPEYLFLAGGIGVTPLLPMIRSVAAAGRPWRLLYGGRRRAGMAFLADLAAYGEKVTVYPEDEKDKLPLHEWLREPAPAWRCTAAARNRCSTPSRNAAHWRVGPRMPCTSSGSTRGRNPCASRAPRRRSRCSAPAPA